MFSSMMLFYCHESAILYFIYKTDQGEDGGKGSNGHGPGNAYVHVACKGEVPGKVHDGNDGSRYAGNGQHGRLFPVRDQKENG